MRALKRHWLPVVLAAGFAVAALGNEGFRVLARNWLEVRTLESELSDLKIAEKDLKRRLHLIETNDVYLEKAARRDLGMMRPGEIEYRFDFHRIRKLGRIACAKIRRGGGQEQTTGNVHIGKRNIEVGHPGGTGAYGRRADPSFAFAKT